MSAISEKGPEYLYKYRRLDLGNIKYIERIFTHNEVYFPCPAEFNDPFDCRIVPDMTVTKAEARQRIMQHLKKEFQHWNRKQRQAETARSLKEGHYKKLYSPEAQTALLENHIKKVGIFSMSAIPDHILMWSHYSDGHKGFCIQFKGDDETPFFGEAQKVNYQKRYPKVHINDDPHDQVTAILLTKAIFWQYEQEWRIFKYTTGPGTYVFPEKLLTGVIFGCLMPDERKEQIKKWVKKREPLVRFYQAQKKEKEFGLDIVPISQ